MSPCRKPGSAALLIGCAVALAACTVDGAWDRLAYAVRSLDWGRRLPLVVDATAVSEPLYDFPLLVTLDPSRIDYDDLQPDGRDMGFFTDSGEPLDFEVQAWNPGGISRIWVRLPVVPAGGSLRLWMYYSSLGRDPRGDRPAVWQGGYAAVWHLDEAGGSPQVLFRDSSGNGCDGRGGWFAGTTSPLGDEGWIEAGQRFGVNASAGMGIPSPCSLDDLGPVTWSFWLRHEGLSESGDRVFVKGGIQLWLQSSNLLKLEVTFHDGGTTNKLLKEFTGAFPSGTWVHLALAWDGSPLEDGVTLYRNGLPVADSNRRNATGSRSSDVGLAAGVGNGAWDEAKASLGRTSAGAVLDEMRVSRSVRSASWIRAEHLGDTDALITYGAPEVLP